MDTDGNDRRSFLASTALAAVAGAAGASVLSGATPAGAATSDVRVRGTFRVGSGLITPAAGRTLQERYDGGQQIGALGVRIDDAPIAGVPGTTFSPDPPDRGPIAPHHQRPDRSGDRDRGVAGPPGRATVVG